MLQRTHELVSPRLLSGEFALDFLRMYSVWKMVLVLYNQLARKNLKPVPHFVFFNRRKFQQM